LGENALSHPAEYILGLGSDRAGFSGAISLVQLDLDGSGFRGGVFHGGGPPFGVLYRVRGSWSMVYFIKIRYIIDFIPMNGIIKKIPIFEMRG
jgi:hypothetical protein